LLGALRYVRDPLGSMERLAGHGDIVDASAGARRAFFITHPDLIRELLVTRAGDLRKGVALRNSSALLGQGLLTSEGETHRRQRQLIQPVFHARHVSAYADDMVRYAAAVRDRWEDGRAIDIHEEMTALTLSIVAKTLFDVELESEVREIGRNVSVAVDIFDRNMVPWGKWLGYLPLPRTLRFYAARRFLFRRIDRIIADRRAAMERRGEAKDATVREPGAPAHASGEIQRGRESLNRTTKTPDPFASVRTTKTPDPFASAEPAAPAHPSAARADLVSLLLSVRDESGGAGMSDQQVRDEALTIFLAGHETTANALTFTWYALANNPSAAEMVHKELDEALAGRLPTMADLPNLKYTRAAIAESMRLYPPAWAVGRETLREIELGGYTIPAGSLILASQFVTHRDARFFPDPLRFDLSRWTDEAVAARPKYAYFPFGGGPRLCRRIVRVDGTDPRPGHPRPAMAAGT
jgi:cytochrome P450